MSYLYRDDGNKGWGPHTGGKSVNPNYSYQYHDGKIHSGMTRVFWELNGAEKDKDKGGTAFVPGTHKSNYRKKRNLFDEWVSEVWESYSCPPGSLLIFSEGGGATPRVHGSRTIRAWRSFSVIITSMSGTTNPIFRRKCSTR